MPRNRNAKLKILKKDDLFAHFKILATCRANTKNIRTSIQSNSKLNVCARKKKAKYRSFRVSHFQSFFL